MKLTFYANACCTYESEGFTLLADPWLTEGAFEDSWGHWPPIQVKPQDLVHVNALYISHLHPDHYDPETLKHFSRDIPIFALDHGWNFLITKLWKDGFRNIIGVRDHESAQIGPLTVRMFAPFVGNPFHNSSVGNLIDSALWIRDGQGTSVLNTNDNTPDLESARMLRHRYGIPDVAQLAYNAAGPFPSCFDHLSACEKGAASMALIDRNIAHLIAVAATLKSPYVMPFAGSYRLLGRLAEKNAYLGTTTPDVPAARIGSRSVVLPEGIPWTIGTPLPSPPTFHPPPTFDGRRYAYQDDLRPDTDALLDALGTARARLWKAQERFSYFPAVRMTIALPRGHYSFSWEHLSVVGDDDTVASLTAALNTRLLARILTRKAHWNNAEIGGHISFHRTPDVYLPDVHTLLSFFHV